VIARRRPILDSLFVWTLFIPVAVGSLYAILCVPVVIAFCRQARRSAGAGSATWPAVTILKPVCGPERDLRANLESACRQDYPEYQVVISAQNPGDPAVTVARKIQEQFGTDRVSVVVADVRVGLNGKVNNLLGALPAARHDILVISDSDVRLEPGYLKAMIAPLADKDVAAACSLFRAVGARRWFERFELLTVNADFIPGVIFAHVTGLSRFCLGPSLALRRSTLESIGGLESLGDYLTEDYEIGRRIWEARGRLAVVPQFVDTTLDLGTASHWWKHQVYWDQNTRAARPGSFFATILMRAVPFACLFAVARLGDDLGLAVLAGAVGVRLVTAAAMLGYGLRDGEGLQSLWLLPLRDLLGLVWWVLAFAKRTVVWRGAEFVLSADGRLVPDERRMKGKVKANV
jgi:ceramide glucosyltransferase